MKAFVLLIGVLTLALALAGCYASLEVTPSRYGYYYYYDGVVYEVGTYPAYEGWQAVNGHLFYYGWPVGHVGYSYNHHFFYDPPVHSQSRQYRDSGTRRDAGNRDGGNRTRSTRSSHR